jgi:hypothetical protein
MASIDEFVVVRLLAPLVVMPPDAEVAFCWFWVLVVAFC